VSPASRNLLIPEFIARYEAGTVLRTMSPARCGSFVAPVLHLGTDYSCADSLSEHVFKAVACRPRRLCHPRPGACSTFILAVYLQIGR
jgi:hypothetical protein